MMSLGLALIQSNLCSYKRRLGHRGKIPGRYREKMTIFQPKREALEETSPADSLAWTSSLQTVRKEISVVAATRSVVLCYGTLANSHVFSKPSTSSRTHPALPTNSWCADHPHSRATDPLSLVEPPRTCWNPCSLPYRCETVSNLLNLFESWFPWS